MGFDDEMNRATDESRPSNQNGNDPEAKAAPAQSGDQDLESQINVERARAEEYLKHWQRSQADFINFRRRNEQERTELVKYANSKLILQLLPVLDDFERALATMPDELQESTWGKGMRLIDRKLRSALEKEGVTPIEAVGQDFDPNLHEALLHEDAGDENSGKVTEELQKGYMIGDRLLRPTRVKVGK